MAHLLTLTDHYGTTTALFYCHIPNWLWCKVSPTNHQDKRLSSLWRSAKAVGDCWMDYINVLSDTGYSAIDEIVRCYNDIRVHKQNNCFGRVTSQCCSLHGKWGQRQHSACARQDVFKTCFPGVVGCVDGVKCNNPINCHRTQSLEEELSFHRHTVSP